MRRYLILAHQTASSPELINAVRRLITEQGEVEFVLLIPATPPEDLLDWQDGTAEDIARRAANMATPRLEAAGARILRADIGDASPLKAVQEAIKGNDKYDGIIIATLPLQRSRWMSEAPPKRIERQFKIPVTHVIGRSVTMDREQLIDGLNKILNLELETVLRGVYHAASARGMLGHELRELLKQDVPSELGHAMFLADKIVALGGQVEVHPTSPRPLEAARDLLQQNIAAEREIIAHYNDGIDQASEYGDKGLMIRLEEILAQESDHLDALERLGR